MCSIIGFYSNNAQAAAPILVKSLKRMEYRGYDSVGIATNVGSEILVRKGVGRVHEVNAAVKLEQLEGNMGIGHTRWATHGSITESNAHPHLSNSGKIAVVHNGIIENFEQLKSKLQGLGYTFESQTDTEVISNLIQYHYQKNPNEKEALMAALAELEGQYSFVVMFDSGVLAAARFHKPLIIGVGKDSYFLSSDVLGFAEKTDEAIYIKNNNIVIIDKELHVFDFDGKEQKLVITKVSKEFADVYKGDYAHYTIKEISEQPQTILNAGQKDLNAIEQTVKDISNAKNTYITGSGTSYNAALIAKYMISKYAKMKIEPIISSELTHSPETIGSDSVFIAISQSGESADVLEAVSIAKQANAKIISILNIMNSSLGLESSIKIAMNCGPEIGVAATKSFTAQLIIIYKIIDKLAGDKMELDFEKASKCISEILEDHGEIKKIARDLKNISDIYVLGRGIHYPIAAESALKLKELTYMHAEGIPGGELKHGPLALMDENAFVIIINPDDSTYNDTQTSAHEIKARGAKIIGISDKPSDVYDYWVKIPAIKEAMYPLIEVIPIQLLAYYGAIEKDADPDYPRNLAKSVTVK